MQRIHLLIHAVYSYTQRGTVHKAAVLFTSGQLFSFSSETASLRVQLLPLLDN